MPMPTEISELLSRYLDNRESYESTNFNETQTRVQFLNPFFTALGWDVANVAGYAEAYKDVVHEDAVRVEGATKAPDYCFRVGGARKFFVEAKKPSVKIKTAAGPAYQLRRYGWSAKLPLCILSNFAELSVYDCRKKPEHGDSASTARIYHWTYDQFTEKWDEIAAVFSKDAVLRGSFDKFAFGTKNKRGTTEVDDAFLQEIEGWRISLATNIAQRNLQVNQRELNYCVQQIIDRIVFLRISEDRGIEPYGRLLSLADGGNTYNKLKDIFFEADDRYNSGLFHFSESDGDVGVDSLTTEIKIDDKPLKNIFKRLYYPESPYEFSVLPADILGQVYEQFLGKVITLSRGVSRKVVVEEKPDVKKAGGVYYTPTYVVNYIVQGTLGRLLAGKDLQTASKVTVLDPACGSGSFLIVVYQYFLDWYLQKYVNSDAKKYAQGKRPKIFQSAKGNWQLTTSERKRILLTHIFGVDIDTQAVEVAKLSLLLKVLETESLENIGKNRSMFAERALPELEANVKCGNTIIGPDYFSGSFDFDDDVRYRINAFDWRAEFTEVLSRGGFDIIIGNPPYRRELDHKPLMDEIARSALGSKFQSPRMDLWYYFVHRSLELLSKGGQLSFIVNAYWMSGTSASKLIADIQGRARFSEIFYLDKLKIFRNVAGHHLIFQIVNNQEKKDTVVKLSKYSAVSSAESALTGKESVAIINKTADELFSDGKLNIFPPASHDVTLAEKGAARLNSLGKVRQGIAENPASINKKTNVRFGDKWKVGEGVFVLSQAEVKALHLSAAEKSLLRPYHELHDLGRYYLKSNASSSLIYSTKITCPDVRAYPSIQAHLRRFKEIMALRRETKSGSNQWWHLHWPRQEEIWTTPKILCIQMGARPAFVPATKPVFVPFSVNVFVPDVKDEQSMMLLTGILNSKLLWEWFQRHAKRRGVGLEINGHILEAAPIRLPNIAIKSEVELGANIVRAVRGILAGRNSLDSLKTPKERSAMIAHLDHLDSEIDRMVRELYGVLAA